MVVVGWPLCDAVHNDTNDVRNEVARRVVGIYSLPCVSFLTGNQRRRVAKVTGNELPLRSQMGNHLGKCEKDVHRHGHVTSRVCRARSRLRVVPTTFHSSFLPKHVSLLVGHLVHLLGGFSRCRGNHLNRHCLFLGRVSFLSWSSCAHCSQVPSDS